ncbi:MAG: prepilin peptidase [Anaerolineae bacterium]
MILLVIGVVLLGLLVGTAASHVAEAALSMRRVSVPRCPYCTEPYAPLQWSATLAFVTGSARCRACGRHFRLPRLAGELFLATGWALLATRYGMSPRVGLAMVALVPLAMILVTDLEAKRVPNVITLSSLAVMLVVGSLFGLALPWTEGGPWWSSLAGAALGFVIFRLLIWLGVAIFGEGALGEGDMTLASYVGAAVGFPVVLEALLLAFLLGGLGAFLVLVVRKGGLKTAIPYGPFIILGCAISLIWGGELLQWFFS